MRRYRHEMRAVISLHYGEGLFVANMASRSTFRQEPLNPGCITPVAD